MTSKKPVALIFTSFEGHLSIAEAAGAALEDKYEVVYHTGTNKSFAPYVAIYQLFPSFFKIPYALSQNIKTVSLFSQYMVQTHLLPVRQVIQTYQPAICISTHFIFNSSLEIACQEQGIPFVNLLSDPKTTHPILVSEKADSNAVFDETQGKIVAEFFPSARTQKIGWLVRPAFATSNQRVSLQRRLGASPKEKLWIVVSGSEGTAMTLKLLPALLGVAAPTLIYICCGSNRTMLKTVKGFARLISMSNPHVRIKAIGFTDKLHEYLQAADLVIGKAGPNTLFESAACLAPFLAITHISGQEDGNLELIKQHKLGWVEENSYKLQEKISWLSSHPKAIAARRVHLQRFSATYLEPAPKNLRSLVDQLLS
jgi:1,2-diacylglycerol 3-beta-galactosyltransferase